MSRQRIDRPLLFAQPLRLLCVVAGAIVTAVPLAAQTTAPEPTSQPVSVEKTQGPVHVEVSVDSDRVAMAQPFHVHVRIEAEKDVAVGTPDYKDLLGDFEIIETQTVESPPCDDFHDCHEFVLTLLAAMPGDTTIPPLTVAFRDDRPKMDGSDNSVQGQFETDAIPIRVENSLAGIKGPADLPMPFAYQMLWWVMGILVGLAVVGLVARWWLRRPRRIPVATLAPQLPPYEWAMRELNQLIADNLVGKGQIQEFYFRINLLLRQYIERRFAVNAGEQTSEEFIRSVQTMGALSADQRDTLRRFVAACDPVKYARQMPTIEETDWVLHTAREFVIATRPLPLAGQPSAVPASPAEVSQ